MNLTKSWVFQRKLEFRNSNFHSWLLAVVESQLRNSGYPFPELILNFSNDLEVLPFDSQSNFICVNKFLLDLKKIWRIWSDNDLFVCSTILINTTFLRTEWERKNIDP